MLGRRGRRRPRHCRPRCARWQRSGCWRVWLRHMGACCCWTASSRPTATRATSLSSPMATLVRNRRLLTVSGPDLSSQMAKLVCKSRLHHRADHLWPWSKALVYFCSTGGAPSQSYRLSLLILVLPANAGQTLRYMAIVTCINISRCRSEGGAASQSCHNLGSRSCCSVTHLHMHFGAVPLTVPSFLVQV